MDVLSRILDRVAMRGSLYYPTEFRACFGLTVPANRHVCRFHVAVEGGCLLSANGQTLRLEQGDLALVPHGLEHLLQDQKATPPVPLDEAIDEAGYSGDGPFRWGGEGPACRLICGHFDFDKDFSQTFLRSLPPIVHVPATSTYDFRWIDQVMRFIGEEVHDRRPGSEAIARRLSEVLFVQVIRHYAESAEAPVPILAGIADPQLSRVLDAVHSRLDHPWTLEALAREGAMSRTSFTSHFSKLMGMTPMTYLTEQRMIQACKLLRAGETLGSVADRVGYRSEAAFSRKFKEHLGQGPGAYRRAHRQSAETR
ncbi:MAG: AraC family transcriptional regulator [Acidobacteriota bacterium]